MTLEFSGQIFFKILKYKISLKSVLGELSCSMRTERRTVMTKLIVAFLNFTSISKKTKLKFFLFWGRKE